MRTRGMNRRRIAHASGRSPSQHCGPEPDNASEIVALADVTLLFCDNNTGDALCELRLAADGTMACPLMRRPLRGMAPGTVDDLEGMTQVRTEGRPPPGRAPFAQLAAAKQPDTKKRSAARLPRPATASCGLPAARRTGSTRRCFRDFATGWLQRTGPGKRRGTCPMMGA